MQVDLRLVAQVGLRSPKHRWGRGPHRSTRSCPRCSGSTCENSISRSSVKTIAMFPTTPATNPRIRTFSPSPRVAVIRIDHSLLTPLRWCLARTSRHCRPDQPAIPSDRGERPFHEVSARRIHGLAASARRRSGRWRWFLVLALAPGAGPALARGGTDKPIDLSFTL